VKKFIAILAIFIALPISLTAQAQGADGYILQDVSYRIDGMLLEFALSDYLAIEPGLTFKSIAQLESYIAEKDRLLKNNRVFEVESAVSLEFAPELGPGAVRVLVYAKVGWSALAVPFPKYSDADGFSIALRYKDYNFLGTLETLSLAFDYYFTDSEASLIAEFGLLPEFLGTTWKLGFTGGLTYTESAKLAPPDFTASLSASYPLPLLGETWSLAPSTSYRYEQHYDRHTINGGLALKYSFDALFRWSANLSNNYTLTIVDTLKNSVRSTIGLSTRILISQLSYFGAFNLSPSTGVYTAYNLGTAVLDDAGWTTSASLGFSRADWVGNLRKGASLSLSSAYTLHFIVPVPKDLYDWATTVSASAFYAWGGLVGLNFRAMGRWEGTWTLLGEANTSVNYATSIRGLKEARYGDLGYFYNLELPINLAQGRFLNQERFSTEVFFVPFIDGGYVRPNPQAELFAEADTVFCGGFEFVIFPDYARAFTYRLSVGYDLGDYLASRDFEAGKLEIWLGLGMQF
jgi:hypothetical protein